MDIDPTVVLIGGIITWRLSTMVVKETGPFAIFARVRAKTANISNSPGGLYELVSCISCASVYIGSIAALGAADGVLELVWYSLSFSAVAVLTERLTKKGD